MPGTGRSSRSTSSRPCAPKAAAWPPRFSAERRRFVTPAASRSTQPRGTSPARGPRASRPLWLCRHFHRYDAWKRRRAGRRGSAHAGRRRLGWNGPLRKPLDRHRRRSRGRTGRRVDRLCDRSLRRRIRFSKNSGSTFTSATSISSEFTDSSNATERSRCSSAVFCRWSAASSDSQRVWRR